MKLHIGVQSPTDDKLITFLRELASYTIKGIGTSATLLAIVADECSPVEREYTYHGLIGLWPAACQSPVRQIRAVHIVRLRRTMRFVSL